MPHFDYKRAPLCGMAAFKNHCAFGFWKAVLMKDKQLVENAKAETSMGHLGKISSLKDLPPDKKMIAYIKEAMQINELGIKLPAKPKSTEKKELDVPDYFMAALKILINGLRGNIFRRPAVFNKNSFLVGYFVRY